MVSLGLSSGPARAFIPSKSHDYDESSPGPTLKVSNWATVRDAFCNSPSSMNTSINRKSSLQLGASSPESNQADRNVLQVSSSGKQRQFWRVAKMALTAATVVSSGTVPMCIAFGAPANTTWQFVFGKSFILGPLDGFIWFLLALTELIRRTSFTKDHEELEAIQDQASVRFSKFTRLFHSVIDATSMLPLDIVAMAAGVSSMRTVGLFRLTRLVRIAREFHTATKRGHTTAACITVGLVVIHILSCIYWLMASGNDGAGLRGFGSKDVVMEGWSQQNWSLPYIFSIYFVVSALGGVSIVVEPETIDETIFTLVLMFLSIAISAGISAMVCMLMQNALIEKQSSQISKNTVSEWMRSHKFPFTSRVAIFQRLEMAPMGDSQSSFEHAMNILPRALLMDHCFIQYEALLRECPLFANMESCIVRELCIELRPKTFAAGDFVYRYGNRSLEGIVFVRKGIAKIFAQDSKDNKILSRGQFHDTNALFSNSPRTDSLKALSSLDIVTLSKSSFDHIMEAYASVDPEGIQRALEDFQCMLVAESLEVDPSTTSSSPVGPQEGPDDFNERIRRKGSSGSVSCDQFGRSGETDRSAKNTCDISKNSTDVDPTTQASFAKRKLDLELENEGRLMPSELASQVQLGQDDQHD